MTLAAGLLGAPLWFLAAVAAPPASDATQKIAVEVRGPVALVQVTRPLSAEASGSGAAERVLDLALPEHAALVDVALSERGAWRPLATTPTARATRDYVDGLGKRGLKPANEPLDDGTTLRVRVAGGAPLLRYRFALLPEIAEGRQHVRFPASPERMPVPADVAVSAPGAAEVTIAGTRALRARASTRGAWEISWLARKTGGPGPAPLAGSLAFARLSATETLAAVSAEARGRAPLEPPPNVLFLIDRSRSVGLPGLAAERDLAGRLLESLPPSTRFDALFFDRQVRRLFPMSRPATREALSALEAELVPDRLQNGTDLLGALRDAGTLLRREANAFAPRALLVLVTDGALPEGADGAALVRALGETPGVDLALATFIVRPGGDDAAPAAATRALRHLAAAHGGVLRELGESELGTTLPLALATLTRGGDVAEVALVAGGGERALASHLAPGNGQAAVLKLSALGPAALIGTASGARVRLPLHAQPVDSAWLRALADRDAGLQARQLATDTLVALVEAPVRASPPNDTVRGSLDRIVVRNTLALAFMPRARACYLSRRAATPAERDLTGRVRLAIDLTRGEVGDVTVLSSTLSHAGVETCLRDSAFAIEVPRTLRSDSPSTAILNLVFRPRTPEKHESAAEAALGEQIDLVIEELHRGEPVEDDATPVIEPPVIEPPFVDRSMIPTR